MKLIAEIEVQGKKKKFEQQTLEIKEPPKIDSCYFTAMNGNKILCLKDVPEDIKSKKAKADGYVDSDILLRPGNIKFVIESTNMIGKKVELDFSRLDARFEVFGDETPAPANNPGKDIYNAYKYLTINSNTETVNLKVIGKMGNNRPKSGTLYVTDVKNINNAYELNNVKYAEYVVATFYDEDGTQLGHDNNPQGADRREIRIFKTKKKSFDKIVGAGIKGKTKQEIIDFILANNQNYNALKQNALAYDNTVVVISSALAKDGIRAQIMRDSGTGEATDTNRREYGGMITYYNKVFPSNPGNLVNPCKKEDPLLEIIASDDKEYSFHTHPSAKCAAVEEERKKKANSTGATGSFNFSKDEEYNGSIQTPSEIDINNSDTIGYVFARGTKYVYIYNRNGVLAQMTEAVFFSLPSM